MILNLSIPLDVHALASKTGVSLTVPELECDIDSQIRALLDPDHPKMAVFLARGNSLGARRLPDWVFVEQRKEGTLLTDKAEIAVLFRTIDFVTDDLLAAMLGYPESKSTLIGRIDVCVVQALDVDGSVVFEAAASHTRLQETLAAADRQVPYGGRRVIVSAVDALARRHHRMN